MNSNNRIEYLDIAKGIGIILVIIGHCISMKSYMGRFIYTFHMPLFFFIAGLCFNETRYTFSIFLTKRIRQLIVPCIFFTLLLCLGAEYIMGKHDFMNLDNHLPSTLWFIPILFLAEILFYVVCKLIKNDIIRITFIVSLGFAGYYLKKYNIDLPYSLTAVPVSMVFYGVGYYIKKYIGIENKIGKKNNIYIFILSVVSIILFLQFTKIRTDLHYNIFFHPIENYICAFIGIGGLFSISHLISIGSINIIKNFLLYCGKNTLVIMSIHLFYLNVYRHLIRPLIKNMEMLFYNSMEQIFMWTLVCFSIWLINRKFAWIIGK